MNVGWRRSQYQTMRAAIFALRAAFEPRVEALDDFPVLVLGIRMSVFLVDPENEVFDILHGRVFKLLVQHPRHFVESDEIDYDCGESNLRAAHFVVSCKGLLVMRITFKERKLLPQIPPQWVD